MLLLLFCRCEKKDVGNKREETGCTHQCSLHCFCLLGVVRPLKQQQGHMTLQVCIKTSVKKRNSYTQGVVFLGDAVYSSC